MRTWSYVLPPGHHALEASIERLPPRTARREKARHGAGSAGPPYALAKETGCPEGNSARRTARALA